MADTKISALPAATTLADTDELPIASGGATKKITGANLKASMPAPAGGITVLYNNKLTVDTATLDTGAGGIAGTSNLLELWLLARTDEAALYSTLKLTFNNDTGAKYDYYEIDASATGAGALTTGTSFGSGNIQFNVPGATGTANFFGHARLAMPFYAETVAYKEAEFFLGLMPNVTAADQRMKIRKVQFRDTAAITRVTIAPFSVGPKLKAGSHLLIVGR